ncbi:MAG: penicillin-binding transpeptidase domain-containing protein [Collinsella sp.]
MAAAYATFANGGYYRQPIAITEIDLVPVRCCTSTPTTLTGTTEARPRGHRCLSGVMKGGGTGAAGALSVNQPYAGKTGTTDNTTNLWFCGYTPQLACALWTGYSAGEIPIQNTARTCWATAPTCQSLSGL